MNGRPLSTNFFRGMHRLLSIRIFAMKPAGDSQPMGREPTKKNDYPKYKYPVYLARTSGNLYAKLKGRQLWPF